MSEQGFYRSRKPDSLGEGLLVTRSGGACHVSAWGQSNRTTDPLLIGQES